MFDISKLGNGDVVRICLCTKDYICNYPFLKGKKYKYIKHHSRQKTLFDSEFRVTRKTFSDDGEFERYFLDIEREERINSLIS